MHPPETTAASRLSLPAWERTPRYEVEAIVREQRLIVGHEFEIVFHAPDIANSARPGQFVEILFGDNYAPLVRRPFSLYRVDPNAGTFSVIYLARGAFTSGLARKQAGDAVSLLGPLGRPFHQYDEPGIQHILVAGGLGAPPLYFLACVLSQSCLPMVRAALPAVTARAATIGPVRTERTIDLTDAAALAELSESPLVVINAARTESLLVGLTEFGALDIALHVMTDDGSRGARGMATDLLTALLDCEAATPRARAIYACGPMPMLRSVGEIAIAHDLPCQLSIETSMPCGTGLCQGCATPIHDAGSEAGFSYVLACVDGPVFEARDLVWG